MDDQLNDVSDVNILEWSVEDVHTLLCGLGLPQYMAQLQGQRLLSRASPRSPR